MKYDAETIRGVLQLDDLGTPEEIALALAKKCGKKPEMESALQEWKAQKGIFRRSGSIETVVEKVLSREDNPTIVRYEDFAIEELSDRYRLHNVPYLAGVGIIDWSKELLEQGRANTPDRGSKLSKNREFQLPSLLAYTATVQGLHQHQNGAQKKLVGKVRSMLQKDMRDYCMLTSSRILYNPSSPDKIIHGYGTGKEISFEADFVSANQWVSKNISDLELKSLFGTSDADKIVQAYNWFSEKNLYLWRVNSRPEVLTEKVVWLNISSDRFNLNYYIIPFYNLCRSRGVQVSRCEAPRAEQ